MNIPRLTFKKYSERFTQTPSVWSLGFTLVEFIVIMAIFAVMVGVVLFNFTGFRSKITLDNLAQDIALSIRQIQTSAGAAISSSDNPQEEIPRGIYFPIDGDTGTYAAQFILFQDNDGSGTYSPNTVPSELIDTVNIQTPDRIIDIVYGSDISGTLTSLGLQPLGITFRRYSTGAKFSDPSGAVAGSGVVRIKVTSADKKISRFITISKIGQVSVQADNTDPTNP
jgi:Tfp pilus assembly protein FimT